MSQNLGEWRCSLKTPLDMIFWVNLTFLKDFHQRLSLFCSTIDLVVKKKGVLVNLVQEGRQKASQVDGNKITLLVQFDRN